MFNAHVGTPRKSRPILTAAAVTVSILVANLLLCGAHRGGDGAGVITGPYARLLAQATDLGPARSGKVKLTAALNRFDEPLALRAWANANDLAVHWDTGDNWAVLEGSPSAVSTALGVTVHDYRVNGGLDTGRVFYGSPQQPDVPRAVRSEVAGLGRVLGYLPSRESFPSPPPRDVPDGGLLPHQLLTAYNAMSLAEAGYTGKGVTVVVFGFDGFDQEDMDSYAEWFDVSPFSPKVVGGMPEQRSGEATMDLQVIHAVAPDATLVLVNARPTVEEGGGFDRVGQLMESVDREFPGAIWSLSIGWGCDRMFTAADLAPVRTALSRAQENGTTAFVATGDLAGLECRGGQTWSDPPSPDDVGVDAVAAIPEMTSVGGTRLATNADGEWVAEQSWYNVPLTQGSAGGASTIYRRPAWQAIAEDAGPADSRLVPDVSAVADPSTGVKFVFNQQVLVGGGTSQAAPIWAGFAALINQQFREKGHAPLGDINPVLYGLAAGSLTPSFRDIQLGGNAIAPGGRPGYDMVTGLGSPIVDNLLKNIVLSRAAGR